MYHAECLSHLTIPEKFFLICPLFFVVPINVILSFDFDVHNRNCGLSKANEGNM